MYVFFTLGFFNISFALIIAITTFYLPKGQGLAFRSLWMIPRISPAVIYVLLWKWFTYDTGFLPTVFGIDGNIMMLEEEEILFYEEESHQRMIMSER